MRYLCLFILLATPILFGEEPLDIIAEVVAEDNAEIRALAVGRNSVCWLQATTAKQQRLNRMLGKPSVVAVKVLDFSAGKAQQRTIWRKDAKIIALLPKTIAMGNGSLYFRYSQGLSRPQAVYIYQQGRNWQIAHRRMAKSKPLYTLCQIMRQRLVRNSRNLHKSLTVEDRQLLFAIETTIGNNRIQYSHSVADVGETAVARVRQLLRKSSVKARTNGDRDLLVFASKRHIVAIHEGHWDRTVLHNAESRIQLAVATLKNRRDLATLATAITGAAFLQHFLTVAKVDKATKQIYRTFLMEIGPSLRTLITVPVPGEPFAFIVSLFENKAHYLPAVVEFTQPPSTPCSLLHTPQLKTVLYAPLQYPPISRESLERGRVFLATQYSLTPQITNGLRQPAKIAVANIPAVISSARLHALDIGEQKMLATIRVETGQFEILKQFLGSGVKLVLEWDSTTLGFAHVDTVRTEAILTIATMQEIESSKQYAITFDLSASFWRQVAEEQVAMVVTYVENSKNVVLKKPGSHFIVSFPQRYDVEGKPLYRFQYRLEHHPDWREEQFPFVFISD